GAGLPREDMVPMTKVAESAEDTKKMLRTITRSTGVIEFKGSWSNNAQRTCSLSAVPSNSARPWLWKLIAAPPKIVKARIKITVGAAIVASANSRMDRPREIRAMNIPTNGVQAIHQAQ